MGLIAKNTVYRGVPEELITLLKNAGNFQLFIESGTYLGDTAKWASGKFAAVKTIEASEDMIKKINFTGFSNIELVQGFSQVVLDDLLTENSVLYLDAHYSGGETYNSNPLLEEIECLNKSNFDHAIIIDDARFCLSHWNYENYCSISELIKSLNKKPRYIVVFDDMIIAVPTNLKDVVNMYCNQKSNSYWEKYASNNRNIFKRVLNKFMV